MQFAQLLEKIQQSNIRYIIVGGIAVNLHGIIRPTKDLDLVVYLEQKNLERFIQLMTKLGFVPKVPVKPSDFADPKKRQSWIKEKNMIVFSFYHQDDLFKVIDVFVRHPLPFEGMYKRIKWVNLGDIKLPVAGIDDLIRLKLVAGRQQDRSDIIALEKVKKLHLERHHEKQKKQKKTSR